MSVWIHELSLGLAIGLVSFLIFFIPGIIWQYRRYGGFNFARMLGLAAVCFYFSALVAYTMLPLPENPHKWCTQNHITPNLKVFNFLSQLKVIAAHSTTRQLLLNTAFLQVAFNVLLFIPFGIIFRRFYNYSLLSTTLLGLVTTILIEVTQGTGIWFIYPCAYRWADVDDVIMNTLGAFLGALIAPLLLWWMPSAKKLTYDKYTPRPITVWRRWTGMLFDFLAFTFSYECLIIIYSILTDSKSTRPSPTVDAACTTLSLALVYLLPICSSKRTSLGQSLVWIKPMWRKNGSLTDGNFGLRLLRAAIVPTTWLVYDFWDIFAAPPKYLNEAGVAVVLLAVLMVPFTKNKRSLSGLLTNAEFIDSRFKMPQR